MTAQLVTKADARAMTHALASDAERGDRILDLIARGDESSKEALLAYMEAGDLLEEKFQTRDKDVRWVDWLAQYCAGLSEKRVSIYRRLARNREKIMEWMQAQEPAAISQNAAIAYLEEINPKRRKQTQKAAELKSCPSLEEFAQLFNQVGRLEKVGKHWALSAPVWAEKLMAERFKFPKFFRGRLEMKHAWEEHGEQWLAAIAEAREAELARRQALTNAPLSDAALPETITTAPEATERPIAPITIYEGDRFRGTDPDGNPVEGVCDGIGSKFILAWKPEGDRKQSALKETCERTVPLAHRVVQQPPFTTGNLIEVDGKVWRADKIELSRTLIWTVDLIEPDALDGDWSIESLSWPADESCPAVVVAQPEALPELVDAQGTSIQIGTTVVSAEAVDNEAAGEVAEVVGVDRGNLMLRYGDSRYPQSVQPSSVVVVERRDSQCVASDDDFDPLARFPIAASVTNIDGDLGVVVGINQQLGLVVVEWDHQPELQDPCHPSELTVLDDDEAEAIAADVEVTTDEPRSAQMYELNKSGGNGERNTPEYLWRPALEMWCIEAFDLDPMTNDRSTVPAHTQYTKADNGLAKPWKVYGDDLPVRLYANPDFSLQAEFAAKLAKELADPSYDLEAIVINKDDHRADWCQRLLELSSVHCRVDHGVSFEGFDKHGNPLIGAPFSVTLFYFGPNVARFVETHQHLGRCFVEI